MLSLAEHPKLTTIVLSSGFRTSSFLVAPMQGLSVSVGVLCIVAPMQGLSVSVGVLCIVALLGECFATLIVSHVGVR